MKGIITIKSVAMQAPKANPLNLVASKPANNLPSLARSFELYYASSAAVFIPFILGLFEISTIIITSLEHQE